MHIVDRTRHEEPVLLAVWNRELPADGPGGTADAVAFWEQEGREVDVIDLGDLSRSDASAGPAPST